MNKLLCTLIVVIITTLGLRAQEFVGKVTDSDSSKTPFFQAEVSLILDGKVVSTQKTFFDGTFRVKLKPSQTYQLKASYPGYQDSIGTLLIDKKGNIKEGTLFISLHKDGLRLMGYIVDRDRDEPIQKAGLILRNVMTRKEEKYFTDVNGYYNLRMEFETNYSLKIDKRSPGIMNKFQDSSFNISTIGFNQAMNFRFDIKLGPASTHVTARQDYDPHAEPTNKNIKPVVEVYGIKDSVKIREQALAIASVTNQLREKDSLIAALDRKISDINTAKDATTVKQASANDGKTINQEKQPSAAEKESERRRAEEMKRAQAEQDAKSLKEKQLAEKALNEKLAEEKAMAEARKKDQDRLEKEQKLNEQKEKALAQKQLMEELAREEKIADEKRKVEKQIANAKTQAEKERIANAEADKLRIEAESIARRRLAEREAAELKKAKDKKEIADKAKAEEEAKKKREQLEHELAELKRVREIAETARLNEQREAELREKQAKKNHKKPDEIRFSAEDNKRNTERTTAQDIQRRELEAKKNQQEAEKRALEEKLQQMHNTDEQVKVAKAPDTKKTESESQLDSRTIASRNMIEYYENKIKNQSGAAAIPAPPKLVTVRGSVKNGQTEQSLMGVSVNVRQLNRIVSQEVTTDSAGNYDFQVDSGYFYLVSYFKEGFIITKQILDLTSYRKPSYVMLTQYLNEIDDFDPSAKMPLISFDKNSARLPNGLWGDLENIVKLMKDVPDLKIKIYGLSSVDEDYPMELSVSRARIVANLILESGIKSGRIRIHGMGAFRPRSGCVEGRACTEGEYKLDRVVMYKVVKE